MRPDKVQDQSNNGQNKQDVNAGARHMKRRKAEDPQQQKNYKQCNKHTYSSPKISDSRIARFVTLLS